MLISGVIFTISYGCITKCATSDLGPAYDLESKPPPCRWSDFCTRVDAFGIMWTTSCALVVLLSSIFALLFEYLLIRYQFHESVGAGFWITVVIGAVFAILFMIMLTRLIKEAIEVHRRIDARRTHTKSGVRFILEYDDSRNLVSTWRPGDGDLTRRREGGGPSGKQPTT